MVCNPVRKGCLKLRRNLSFMPHTPTLILSFVFWWFYQFYACGFLAFVEGTWYCQIIYGFLVFGGIGMMTGSFYGTTLQRYPLIPSKFSIGEDFFKQSQEERNRRANEVIQKAGLNSYHVTKLCPTCQIVRPERAHHCSICNRCTPRMDHHCVVLHKCIHNKNQKQFTLFFFWMCFSLSVGIISFHPYIMRAHKEAPKEVKEVGWMNYPIALYSWHYTQYLGKGYESNTLTVVCLVITTVLMYFLLIMFGSLLINFTWFCNIRNGTILDCNKAMIPSRDFPWITRRGINTKCFRKPTKLQNFQVIFGKDWRFWVIPVAISDTDGWLHSCDCRPPVVMVV